MNLMKDIEKEIEKVNEIGEDNKLKIRSLGKECLKMMGGEEENKKIEERKVIKGEVEGEELERGGKMGKVEMEIKLKEICIGRIRKGEIERGERVNEMEDGKDGEEF